MTWAAEEVFEVAWFCLDKSAVKLCTCQILCVFAATILLLVQYVSGITVTAV